MLVYYYLCVFTVTALLYTDFLRAAFSCFSSTLAPPQQLSQVLVPLWEQVQMYKPKPPLSSAPRFQ